MKKGLYILLNPFSSIIKCVSKFLSILFAIVFFVVLLKNNEQDNIAVPFFASIICSFIHFGIDKFMKYLNVN